ncbi:MAG: 2-oxoacid:acceptor oxidoreductase subunit alpha [Candidatus Neomarinimicrobiota bacterium]|tara:strand:+ start:3683 stop:5533 length:1851 start_codon:yes stop_codon:yes gene_type:complete
MAKREINSKEVDLITIRFAGDSGDGMQLTGNQFTTNSALFGNDIATLPDFPAEIRAPQGTLAGVSSFQLQFSNQVIHTPGDKLDVLVAMNPAALRVNIDDLKPNGMIIANTANYTNKNFNLASYETNPLEDGTLDSFKLIKVNMNELVNTALENVDLPSKMKSRSTNMFALGILYWIYERQLDSTIEFLNQKFKSKPEIIEANTIALKSGYNYGDTIEAIRTTYRVSEAKLSKGTYRNIMGNECLTLGLIAAANKAKLDLFFGGYPITPASDILHILSKYKNFGIKTFQAEDEIAGICSVLGAAFAGDLAITASSGPGIALKGEAMGLGIITELPIVVINIQRGGPSTGLPTKTEQSDLNQAMYGRNGECPAVVIAAQSASDCFDTAFEACKIALEFMVPVVLLSDGYIANGSEPWKLPDLDKLPEIKTKVIKKLKDDKFLPYKRDEKTLSRDWALPGTPGLEHRIGGLEKAAVSGNVSYEADNHDYMVKLRQDKIDVIADFIPELEIYGNPKGELLVLSWGGTYGACRAAVEKANANNMSVAHVNLKYINPFPKNLAEILLKFNKVFIPEINLGQLSTIIRSKFLIDTLNLNRVSGKPYTTTDIYEKIEQIIEEN